MVKFKDIDNYYELNQENSAKVFGGSQSANLEKLEFGTIYPSIDGSPPPDGSGVIFCPPPSFPPQATGCFYIVSVKPKSLPKLHLPKVHTIKAER